MIRKLDIKDLLILQNMRDCRSVMEVADRMDVDESCILRRVQKISRCTKKIVVKKHIHQNNLVFFRWQLTEKGKDVSLFLNSFLDSFYEHFLEEDEV